MNHATYIIAVTQALGSLAKSPSNPDSGECFYVEGETRPGVVFVDERFKFKTPEEAIAKARELAAIA